MGQFKIYRTDSKKSCPISFVFQVAFSFTGERPGGFSQLDELCWNVSYYGEIDKKISFKEAYLLSISQRLKESPTTLTQDNVVKYFQKVLKLALYLDRQGFCIAKF